MAKKEEHVTQAAQNQDVADLLALHGHYRWAIIALFYGALHLVQAYLVQIGMVAASHRQRRAQMLLVPELMPILPVFDDLRTSSENARYDCTVFSSGDYDVLRATSYTPIARRLGSLLQP